MLFPAATEESALIKYTEFSVPSVGKQSECRPRLPLGEIVIPLCRLYA